MPDRLRTALIRLLVHLLDRLVPANGRRRAPRPAPARQLHVCPFDPPHLPSRRPNRPPVPPYVAPGTPPLNDRRARRRHHMSLLLALDDVHAEPLLMHGVPSPPPPTEHPRRYGRPC